MNWKEIEKKYPEAFTIFENWENHVAVLSRQKLRLLFDFFDQNGLRLSIIPCSIGWYCRLHKKGTSESLIMSKTFIFELEYKQVLVLDTRIEAETIAFTKLFEILVG